MARTEHGKKYGGRHQSARAKLIRAWRPGDLCYRCGHLIFVPELAEADHIEAARWALSHGPKLRCGPCGGLACNRTHGGRIGAALTNGRAVVNVPAEEIPRAPTGRIW